MNRSVLLFSALFLALFAAPTSLPMAAGAPPVASGHTAWAADLPVFDHVLIVVEENKDFEQVIGNSSASYINGTLRAEGATLTQMYGEEHHSEGNYLWLFSGSNQGVGFVDKIPQAAISAPNLGEALLHSGRSFAGYSEDLPAIGSTVASSGLYARKHVPWVNFSNIQQGYTLATSSHLRFPTDFPSDYSLLPTVSFVIPNLKNDMHNGQLTPAIETGDLWLKQHIDAYYQWAKSHNSLLILTFDESSQNPLLGGLTNPADPDPKKRNRIATVFAGAHVKHGEFAEGKGVNHVNILRTLEAMYGLSHSGAQQRYALSAGIADDFLITDVFY